MLRLNLLCPIAVVVENDGGVGDVLRLEDFAAEGFKFLDGLLYFVEAWARRTVVVQNAVPVFLRAERRCVPAEIIHSHGSVGDGLIGPEAQLALFRLRREHPLAGLP